MATVVDRWTAEPDKRNGKRWDVRWRDEQHRSRRKAFKLRADAERFKTDIEHALSRGTYRDPRDGERPFGEYATTCFESQTHLRNSTRALYDGALRNHLLPFAGHTALNRISADTGRALLASEIAPRMKQVSVQLMRRILNDAVAEMLIPFNPLQTIRIPKHQPAEPGSLTLDELDALVAHTHPHFQTLVRSAAILGLRQGELFGLHPRNLDLHLGTVRVVEQLRTDVRPPQRGARRPSTLDAPSRSPSSSSTNLNSNSLNGAARTMFSPPSKVAQSTNQRSFAATGHRRETLQALTDFGSTNSATQR